MTTAYEAALVELGQDPITEVVARKIIACFKAEARDTDALHDQDLQDLRELPAAPPRADGSD